MKSLSLQNRIMMSAVISLSGLFLSGCGNFNRSSIPTASKASYTADEGVIVDPLENGGFAGDTDYTCPNSPNVLPIYTYHDDGSDQYTVCPSRNNMTDISLHAQTPATTSALRKPRLCVFPYDVVDANHGYYKPNAYGQPLSTCHDVATTIRISHAATNYNAVIIVDEADQADMSWCLKNQAFGSCRRFSYGQFREKR